ncbi:amino acid adenylation domain-containing protein [Streptomyces sp900105245]|uniref:Phenyloxazoline synthase MbtB n=1 Tax=Streptomyces sp. 900105245 TaxID=3154379 RepID=A0ABV1UK36_9ACTN
MTTQTSGTKETTNRDSSFVKCDTDHMYDSFPLTEVQHSYWIGRQGLFEISNVPTHVYVELDGELDPERLNRSFSAMIELHPSLRTEFLPSGEQRILERQPAPYNIPVVDLREESTHEQELSIAQVRDRMSSSAPPLEQWPHFETVLHLLPKGRTRLHVNIDMLVIDAASLNLLFADWGRLYAHSDLRDELSLTFRDYYFAEQEHIGGPAGDAARNYWKERVNNLPQGPELPRGNKASRETLQHPTFGHHFGEISAAEWNSFRKKVQEKGLTVAGALAAAFAETLSMWSADSHFTLNTTTNRRFPLHPQVGKVIGDFTSTLLLELDWSSADSFEDRARRCTDQLLTDLDYSHVSGVEVLREMSRKQGRPVLNPVVFTCALGDMGDSMDWAGELVRLAAETSQVALDNRVQEYHGKLLISWDTLEELYPPGLMQAMHSHYCALLSQLCWDDAAWASQSPGALPSTQAERRAAVNATQGQVPGGLLQDPVLQAAKRHPDRLAVVAEDCTLTYGQLAARVQWTAHELMKAGAGSHEPIAVVTRAGCQRVVGPLGVLQAGAPYVPVDPDIPSERLSVMLQDAGVKLAVTTSDLDASLNWPANVQRILLDQLEPTGVPEIKSRQTPTDTAYIIYTSGSTGRPKGVAIDHRGPINTIEDINRRFSVGPEDRVLALSNLSFDLSVYDIFGVLAAGGSLVYPPAARSKEPSAWVETVEHYQVTLWNTVPLLYNEVVEAADANPSALASLRLVLLSGDWIPVHLPDRSRRINPNAQLISLGGATEASIWSIFYAIKNVDPAWRSVPYGKPLANQRFYVLDEKMVPRPDWVEGDLYIGGIGLAQGYWRDQDRTRQSFIVHPQTGERLYRTGDRGRYLPDGNIEFLGRQDGQVKIRGFRVELGEVESSLRNHADVTDCYVVLRENRADVAGMNAARRSAHQVLVGYVVPAPNSSPSEESLIAFLKRLLPDYMVPTKIMVLDEIPKSANGKVARDKLPVPDSWNTDGRPNREPATTPTETTIARIWSETLDLEAADVGVHDSFFDLGGNSILLARMHRQLSAIYPDQPMEVVQLFEHRTIAQIGEFIDGKNPVRQIDLSRIRERITRKRDLRRNLSEA